MATPQQRAPVEAGDDSLSVAGVPMRLGFQRFLKKRKILRSVYFLWGISRRISEVNPRVRRTQPSRPSYSQKRTWRQDLLKSKNEWTSSCLFALSLVLWLLVAIQLAHQARAQLPTDFTVYRDAAINMLHGGATYRAHFTSVHLNFTYPPFALLLLSVLTLPSPFVVLAIWWLLSSVVLVVIVIVVLNALTELPRRTVVPMALVIGGASCLLLEPVRNSMAFGQINFFLMLAIVADVLVVRSPRRGVLAGLAAAIKLTPLLYVAYFAVIRSRASVVRILGTLAVATAVAWIVLPSDSVLFWFHQAFSPGHKGGAMGTANQSWFGLVGHFSSTLGSSIAIVWLVLSAATLALGLDVAKRYVTSARPVEALLALALTELLVSPISWTHHWSWMILLPVIMIAKWRQDPWVSAAMVLVLLVAVVAPYKWHRYSWYSHGWFRILPGFSLLFAGAALLISMAVTEWQRSRRGGADSIFTQKPLAIDDDQQDSQTPRENQASQGGSSDAQPVCLLLHPGLSINGTTSRMQYSSRHETQQSLGGTQPRFAALVKAPSNVARTAQCDGASLDGS